MEKPGWFRQWPPTSDRREEGGRRLVPAVLAAILIGTLPGSVWGQPAVVDIAQLDPARDPLTRILGSSGRGFFGVPVAGPLDIDGDGFRDLAVAYLRSSPLGRSGAGEVDLVFGDGTIGGTLDTATDQPRLLRIVGDGMQEAAGNEIWMDDVTGDGLGDLLIGRQNFSLGGQRIGAGALTVISGEAGLRDRAGAAQHLDLRASPPPGWTLVGAAPGDRLGIWMRTGDVDGDGVSDIVVGADQEDGSGRNSGAVYVVRGGPHLADNRLVDLLDSAEPPLAGNLARLHPPADSAGYHLGATCLIADLDGNGRGEVLAAAALNRAGASIPPPGGAGEATGGSPRGTVYIAWDDNFPANPWPQDFQLNLDDPPGSASVLEGGAENGIFGEELLGGRDFDADGAVDLFVGDFEADSTPERNRRLSGVGYVFYDAARLKGLRFNLDELPEGMRLTRILGPSSGAIGADTASQGDYDRDGAADLLFGSPHDDPRGRNSAGSIHILFGDSVGWPATLDLAPSSAPQSVRITHIQGARGSMGIDAGDTLCYSAAGGDLDRDGFDDVVTNEMLGNGSSALDTGNLIVLSGRLLAEPASKTSAVFAARALNGGGRFPGLPAPGARTVFSVSNVAQPPFRSPLLDLRDAGRGVVEFYLFDSDGEVSVFSTDQDPNVGFGLNPDGTLSPDATFRVELDEILRRVRPDDPLRLFDGYAWVVAGFPNLAGTCSIFMGDNAVAVRNFELTPALGQGTSRSAWIPLNPE